MTAYSSPRGEWEKRTAQLKEAGLERRMRNCAGATGAKVVIDGAEKHLFCSNDYLGLANHPKLKQAMIQAATALGTGAGASRLVSGNMDIHRALEHAAATFVGKERARLFVSGYQANVGGISALTGRGDAIFSDALVHASLIDGARLSRADVHVYRHSDMGHLERLLKDARGYRLKLVVTDTIFSMDGDVAKLNDIVEISKKHGAGVYIDEAHAIGVVGPGGRGVAAELGLLDDIDVLIATFSKALGVSGAFVATSSSAASLITTKARSLLYTTAPPPPVAAVALESLALVEMADDRRGKLASNIEKFRNCAKSAGLPTLDSTTAIQPIMTGDNRRTMAVSEALFAQGFFVQGIRPPTVPEGEGRLRVTLSANHDTETITALVQAIDRALSKVKE